MKLHPIRKRSLALTLPAATALSACLDDDDDDAEPMPAGATSLHLGDDVAPSSETEAPESVN
jgi:hypothetical protein